MREKSRTQMRFDDVTTIHVTRDDWTMQRNGMKIVMSGGCSGRGIAGAPFIRLG
jgi:hypothetical protein